MSAERREPQGRDDREERELAAAHQPAGGLDPPAARPVAEAWRTPFTAVASVLLCAFVYLSLPDPAAEDAVPLDAGSGTGSTASEAAAPAPREDVVKGFAPAREGERSPDAAAPGIPTVSKPTDAGGMPRVYESASPAATAPRVPAAGSAARAQSHRSSAAVPGMDFHVAIAGALVARMRAAGTPGQTAEAPESSAVRVGACRQGESRDSILLLPTEVFAGEQAAREPVCLLSAAGDPAAALAAWAALVEDGSADGLLRAHGLTRDYQPAAPPAYSAPAN